MITFTPAVLVTGSDNRGNEFCFWKSTNGWVDGYNECFITPEFVRAHVFPIVQKVYFSDLIMTGTEWVSNGCPMELTEEQMHAIEEASALDVVPLEEQVAAEIEQDAKWLDSETVSEWLDEQKSNLAAQGRRYDFTPIPEDMPTIDFDEIDEIQF